MNKPVTITVEGRQLRAEQESSLLSTLLREGFDVPTLCHHESVEPYGACRLCLVEVNQKGWKPEWRKLTTSCNFPVLDGLTVFLNTANVIENLKTTLKMMLAEAPSSPEIRDLAARYGVTLEQVEADFDDLDRDNLCIRCGLCVRICEKLGHSAITILGRGEERAPGTPRGAASADCVGCAVCATLCPTGAIPVTETATTRRIWHREFEMVRCQGCGRAYVTVEQMRHHASRAGLDESYFELCDECSRAAVARKMLEHVT
jgi:NADH dehydrogenase/NADH:ubiquinone oxidoreductase subunit G